MSVHTQSTFSLKIHSAEDGCVGSASTSSTITTTVKSFHSMTTTVMSTSHTHTGKIPQEFNRLISELHKSFANHHPRILSIYGLINKLNAVIVKTERIDEANKALREEVEGCENLEQVKLVGEKMKALAKEREEVDEETMKIMEKWNDAMCWIEEKKVLHEMKSSEGWMKGE